MKIHSILACLLIGSSTSLLAQTTTNQQPIPNTINKVVPGQVVPVNTASAQSSQALGDGNIEEVVVGLSNYDLQTNSAIQPRFMVHANGNMSAAWTMSLDGTTNFNDRGTGYNFFDGTSWGSQPSERLEGERTGWASFVTLPGGGEAYICHTSGGDSYFAKRDVAGTGAWSNSTVTDGTTTLSNVWHRMTVGGASNNTLHVIGAENVGTDADPEYYIRYSRSTDLGATWDLVNVEIPAISDADFGRTSGDSYSIVSNGDNVAFICGGGSKDVVVMKSADNGTTWTKNILWDFPIENFDNSTHLIDSTVVTGNEFGGYYTADGSFHLMYDNTDELHAFFGGYTFSNTDTNDDQVTNFRPGQSELLHWKETYGYVTAGTASIDGTVQGFNQLDSVAFVLDQNGDGEITGSIANYYLSLTSMPSTYLASNGDIYLTYSSIIDTIAEDQASAGDPYDKNQRHQWITKSTDNGVTWEDPQDLLKIFAVEENPLVEAVFGNVVVHDDVVYVLYQRDEVPGLHVRGEEHTPESNEMVVASFLVSDYNILTLEETNTGIFNVAPNPASGSTTVTLAEGHENATVSLINALGQTLYTADAEGNQLTLDTSNLRAGLYIVNVVEGDDVYTQKLMVK